MYQRDHGETLKIYVVLPLVSSPRRPARPLIWIYSPGEIILDRLEGKKMANSKEYVNTENPNYLNAVPSHFFSLVKTTVFAGILTPIENVSVLNKTLTSDSCAQTRKYTKIKLQREIKC